MNTTTATIAATAATAMASSALGAARRWRATDRTVSRLGLTDAGARPVPPRVAAALDAAGIGRLQHRALLQAWVALVVVGVFAALVLPAGPIVAVVVTAGGPLGLVLTSGRAARRRTRDLPVALEAVVARLRAGHALTTALAAAGDADGSMAPEFAAVARRATSGRPLSNTIDEWARTHHDHGTRLAAAALAVAADVGGPGADAIEAAAASLRDRIAVDDEIGALSVQARTSAVLLSVTPIAFTGLLASVDPSAARFLFGTRVGWGCIVAGAGLDVVGAWWMHRLVRRAR